MNIPSHVHGRALVHVIAMRVALHRALTDYSRNYMHTSRAWDEVPITRAIMPPWAPLASTDLTAASLSIALPPILQ